MTDDRTTDHTTLHLRVRKDSFIKFKEKANELKMKPSDLIREMISSVNDDRININLTDEQKKLYR